MEGKIIIFTDLDGTLLDKKSYSFSRALPAIKKCKELRFPIVAVTSKTLEETRQWCEIVDIDKRFIFENGGGIYNGEGKIIEIGINYRQIRDVFKTLKRKYNIRGFGDMDISEIQQHTGLDGEKAALAKERLFSEPFIFKGSNIEALKKDAAKSGLQVISGGRFYHLMSAKQSKGKAIRLFLKEEMKSMPGPVYSIGVGDSPNDLSLLKTTKYGVFVGNKTDILKGLGHGEIYVSKEKGPGGWNEGILYFLKSLVK